MIFSSLFNFLTNLFSSRKYFQYLLTPIIFACSFDTVESQNYNFKDLNNELFQAKYIYDIQQDKDGILIIATEIGVYKYDGYLLEKFDTTTGLADNICYSILIGNGSKFYVGHFQDGISYFDGNNFRQLLNNDLIGHTITSLCYDSDSSIVFSTDNIGVYKLLNNGLVMSILPINNAKVNKVLLVNKVLYACTTNGIFQIKHINDSISKSTHAFLNEYNVKDIVNAKDNYLILITNKGLIKVDQNINVINAFNINENLQVTCGTSFNDSILWLGASNGKLFKININTDNFSFINDYDKENGLLINYIYNLFQDNEGSLWIGSYGNGIKQFTNQQYSWLLPDKESKYQNIKAINLLNKNKILLVDNDKLIRIDSNNSTSVIVDNLQIGKITCIKSYNKLIYIGTEKGAFTLKNYKTIHEIEYLKNDFINTIDVDLSGNIYYGTNNGLVIRDSNFLFKRITTNEGMLHNSVKKVFIDSKSRVWLGTIQSNISFLYNEELHVIRNIHGFNGMHITDICEDDSKNIWFATLGDGIFCIQKDSLIQNYSLKNGLSTNYVYAIQVVNNIVYTGHRNGISEINIQNSNFVNYANETSFMANKILSDGIIYSNNRLIYFATEDGIIIKEPTDNTKELNIKPIIIKVSINNEDFPYRNLLRADYKKNINLKIDFTAPYLSNFKNLKFRYKLRNHENVWHETNYLQLYALYSGLSPGKYNFELQVANNTHFKKEYSTGFTFIINPPFWRTWWFVVILAIIIISMIIIFILIRDASHKRMQDYLSEQLDLRTDELINSKDLLELKNQELTDSIKYAQTILNALLQSNSLKEFFEKSFVFFKPRDIVSGDFFWATKLKDEIFVAAVDCTGHGVPGALMSVIGLTLLNEVINTNGLTDPAAILYAMEEKLIETLSYKGQMLSKDGMDMAIVKYKENSSSIFYAGASSPIFLVRNKEIMRIKGDIFGIGETIENKTYKTEEIKILTDDTLYMCSDGFQDQFGSITNKKLKIKGFKQLLINASELDTEKQKNYFEQKLIEWKGDNIQTDDILIIGIHF